MLTGDVAQQSKVAVTATVATFAGNAAWHYLGNQAASLARQASSYIPSWFSSAPSAPEAVETVRAINPFEWVDKCPMPSDVCLPFEQYGYIELTLWEQLAETSYSFAQSYLGEETAQWLGSYAGTAAGYGADAVGTGLSYLPIIAALPEGARMAGDIYHGRWRDAMRRGGNIGSSAMISVAVANYGIVALPVGLVGRYGLRRAYNMVYGNENAAPGRTRAITAGFERHRAGALAILDDYGPDGQLDFDLVLRDAGTLLGTLGMRVEELDDGTVQIYDTDGHEVGLPRTEDELRALVAFREVSDEVIMDFAEGKFKFGGGDTFVPWDELSALHRLTHVDLPNLARLGVIQIHVGEDGRIALKLDRSQLPADLHALPAAARHLIGHIAAQEGDILRLEGGDADAARALVLATTDADASRALVLATTGEGALTRHISEEGLVTVYGPDGRELALPIGMMGPAFARALDVKAILEAPEADGTLVINIDLGEGGKKKVPVKEAQKAVEQLVADVNRAQEERLRRMGMI